MFPFGGLFNAVTRGILVPGVDSPATFQKSGNVGDIYSGLRLNIDGSMDHRGDLSGDYQTVVTPPNTWMHPDLRPGLNPALFEAMFEWQSLDPIEELLGDNESEWLNLAFVREWYVVADALFETTEIQGLLSVREVADVANISIGDITLRAIETGP